MRARSAERVLDFLAVTEHRQVDRDPKGVRSGVDQVGPGAAEQQVRAVGPQVVDSQAEQVGTAADALIYSADDLGDSLIVGGTIASQAAIATIPLPTE